MVYPSLLGFPVLLGVLWSPFLSSVILRHPVHGFTSGLLFASLNTCSANLRLRILSVLASDFFLTVIQLSGHIMTVL